MLVREAIEEITGLVKKKISYTDIANALEVTRQYANQIKNKQVSVSQLQKLEKYFGVNLANDKQVLAEEDCISVEHIHINPSCGRGTSVYYDADITPVKLGTRLIMDILKVTAPENLKIFTAAGDSMTPTIEDGDVLLCDVGRKDFRNGGIFLITINNEWFIKRLRLKINGDLEIISENYEKYSTETLHPDDEVELVVIGRVIKNLSRGL